MVEPTTTELAVRTDQIRQRRALGSPGIVVGAPLSIYSNAYELYYLFPLTSEEETLSLVTRAIAVAGLRAGAARRGRRVAWSPARS